MISPMSVTNIVSSASVLVEMRSRRDDWAIWIVPFTLVAITVVITNDEGVPREEWTITATQDEPESFLDAVGNLPSHD